MWYNLDENGQVIAGSYINNLPFETDGSEPFSTIEEIQFCSKVDGEWIDKRNYKYFLIPSDLVPQIAHYSGFVKEALFDLAFNVKAATVDAVVEGEEVESPLYINQIPCSCTHWTEEGLLLLDAIVENWDTTYPHKPMREPYKFENYNELMSFINANT